MEAPFVDIHTHNRSRSSHISVVSVFLGDDVAEVEGPISVGVHPWHSDTSAAELEHRFAPYLARAVAIGEIGLDRAISIPIDRQAALLVAQLDIAQKHQLPVVVHCVRAYSDLLPIIRRYKEVAYILHGFYANPKQLADLLPYRTYFSMGLREFQRPNGTAIVRSIPAHRLFLETDDSPASIADVYDAAAKAIGIDITKLREQLYSSYTNLFK